MHSRIISAAVTALLAGLAFVPAGCRTQDNSAPTWQDNAVAELHRLRLPAKWGPPRTRTMQEGPGRQQAVEQYYPRHTDQAARALVHAKLLEHGWRIRDCPADSCYTKNPYTLIVEIGACPTADSTCGMWITVTWAGDRSRPGGSEG